MPDKEKKEKKKKSGIFPVQWEGLSFRPSRCGSRLIIQSFISAPDIQ